LIHGRNKPATFAVSSFLSALGLRTLRFAEVEAELPGTPFVGEVLQVALERSQAAIALLTADEFAALRTDLRDTEELESARWQARPNVIFEAGMAMGILGPTRTLFVSMGGQVRLFSDMLGRHVVRLDNSYDKRWTLKRKLEEAGCRVMPASDSWLSISSGDFEACIPEALPAPADPFLSGALKNRLDDERRHFDETTKAVINALKSPEVESLLKTLTYPQTRSGNAPAKVLSQVADRAEAELKSHFITLDTTPLLGTNGKRWRESYSPQTVICDFLDVLWFAVRDAAPPYTYGKTWVLRDAASKKLFSSMGSNNKERLERDLRTLPEVGIFAGMVLQAIPTHS
jgi:hypothetical protein